MWENSCSSTNQYEWAHQSISQWWNWSLNIAKEDQYHKSCRRDFFKEMDSQGISEPSETSNRKVHSETFNTIAELIQMRSYPKDMQRLSHHCMICTRLNILAMEDPKKKLQAIQHKLWQEKLKRSLETEYRSRFSTDIQGTSLQFVFIRWWRKSKSAEWKREVPNSC